MLNVVKGCGLDEECIDVQVEGSRRTGDGVGRCDLRNTPTAALMKWDFPHKLPIGRERKQLQVSIHSKLGSTQINHSQLPGFISPFSRSSLRKRRKKHTTTK